MLDIKDIRWHDISLTKEKVYITNENWMVNFSVMCVVKCWIIGRKPEFFFPADTAKEGSRVVACSKGNKSFKI